MIKDYIELKSLIMNTTFGYAVIVGVVLLIVIVFTIRTLRKQVAKREKEERNKRTGKPSDNSD